MAGDSDTTGAHRVTTRRSSGTGSDATRWVLTLITAAGLAVDAYVH